MKALCKLENNILLEHGDEYIVFNTATKQVSKKMKKDSWPTMPQAFMYKWGYEEIDSDKTK